MKKLNDREKENNQRKPDQAKLEREKGKNKKKNINGED